MFDCLYNLRSALSLGKTTFKPIGFKVVLLQQTGLIILGGYSVNMQLEVGSVVEGKVTGITKFGAFVELPGGKTGMVHISEVSSTYVKEITDHLSEGQAVKVKVLGVSDEGKVSLSIKKCQEEAPAQPVQQAPRRPFQRENRGWQPKKTVSPENMTFEDMMAKFKQTSEDKMSDLKRGNEVRRSSRKWQSRP